LRGFPLHGLLIGLHISRDTYWSACHATPAPSANGSCGAGSLLHGLLLHGLLIGLHSSRDTYWSACHATPAPSASGSCGAGFLHGLLISRHLRILPFH
jgi:hypothetical protein